MKTTKFNSNFYQPQRQFTVEFATKRLLDLGYKNFQFTGCSYSNGASFYFDGENGEKLRVSDHRLTGKRSFETTQISLEETKYFKIKRAAKKTTSSFILTPEMIEAAAKRKAELI